MNNDELALKSSFKNMSVMKTSKVTKLGHGWSPSQELWGSHGSPPQSTTMSISPSGKEPPTNTSMDSGIAGLRDTPVHTLGPVHSNNAAQNANNNSSKVPHTNNKGIEEIEVPEFIVDHSTRTTYMKGRFLGKGGFARVYEVTDLTTNKTYAGKIIPKCRITKPHHKEKIAREIEVHRHLRHRNVVRFHHYFEDDSNVYIILENCARRSLVHVLKHRRCLTEPEVRYYMRQLAEGVAYVHTQHIVHRDLKLGNMFLTEEMIVKIGDFGLATRLDDSKNVTICGTPNYIAPEVLNKLGHSYEADVWAMGCIMYALLVGQPPFETDTLKETYSRITTNKYAIPPLISEPARNLIRRLLHPDPAARPRLDSLLNHRFFNTGMIPRTLQPSACTQVPKFSLEATGKSCSLPEQTNQQMNKDINKITTSVSTLRIPNQKPLDNNKISILDNGFTNGHVSPPQKPPKEESPKGKDYAPTFSSCLRQKLSSVICASDNKMNSSNAISKKRETTTSGSLYNILAASLDSMPDDISSNPPICSYNPLFISKWIDYSNKYGFGYQLSDLSVGVFFNDLTRISIASDKSKVEFHDSSGRVTCHQSSALPAWLQERYQLLRYFANYMEENLTDAGEVVPHTPRNQGALRQGTIPHIRRWDRTPKSIIMQLSNGTFQINFFKDHTKIILAGDRSDIVIMYISCERQSFTYRLSQISDHGCDAIVRERLVYALSCLRQYAELDGEDV